MPFISLDLITGALSFLFTLMILSYLIGDNPLFKIAVYLFIGVASGYVAAVVFWQVLYPKLFLPMSNALLAGAYNQGLLLVAPLLGVAFIFMKVSPRLSGIARITMAFLVGAGAAVTLAGALTGTIIPQVSATIDFFDPQTAAARNIGAFEVLGNGAILLVGVVTSLAYFHFGASQKPDGSTKRFALIDMFAWIGRIFIGITLGAIFAGVYAAALTAFIERISSLVIFIKTLFGIP
ncbi:MAG: hypothetical protein HYU84_05360 [Chloroflexi bacterium]|nr:hypothetical protein [Chloroflexota bacterium]